MNRLVFATGPIARSEARKQPRRAFRRILSDKLRAEVVVVVASTYTELSGLIRRHEAQVAWLPPAVCVRNSQKKQVQLLLQAERDPGSCFRGALFVRADSSHATLKDLQGLPVAWVDYDSCSGYLFPRLAIRDRGYEPERFFGGQYVLGSHDAVVRAVALGRAEVGATFVDHATDDAGDMTHPGWSVEAEVTDMRTVMLSEPIPADTICASASLPASVQEAVASALETMHEVDEGADALMGLFGANRFQRATLEHYRSVRRALGSSPHLE